MTISTQQMIDVIRKGDPLGDKFLKHEAERLEGMEKGIKVWCEACGLPIMENEDWDQDREGVSWHKACRVVKHTPEPWEYQDSSDAYTHIVRGDRGNKFILQGGQTSCGREEANCRRIVVAVNACAGLSQQALNDGIIAELIYAVESGRLDDAKSFAAELKAN